MLNSIQSSTLPVNDDNCKSSIRSNIMNVLKVVSGTATVASYYLKAPRFLFIGSAATLGGTFIYDGITAPKSSLKARIFKVMTGVGFCGLAAWEAFRGYSEAEETYAKNVEDKKSETVTPTANKYVITLIRKDNEDFLKDKKKVAAQFCAEHTETYDRHSCSKDGEIQKYLDWGCEFQRDKEGNIILIPQQPVLARYVENLSFDNKFPFVVFAKCKKENPAAFRHKPLNDFEHNPIHREIRDISAKEFPWCANEGISRIYISHVEDLELGNTIFVPSSTQHYFLRHYYYGALKNIKDIIGKQNSLEYPIEELGYPTEEKIKFLKTTYETAKQNLATYAKERWPELMWSHLWKPASSIEPLDAIGDLCAKSWHWLRGFTFL